MNSVRKSESESRCHAGLLPNDLEGTSEMAFCFPSIWRAVMGHVFLAFNRSARAWTRCSAMRDRRDANRITQDTKGELSLNRATRFSKSGSQTSYMTSQSRSTPAISKSEFVIHPVGLDVERTFDVISNGHFQRNTVGRQGVRSPITTPPTP